MFSRGIKREVFAEMGEFNPNFYNSNNILSFVFSSFCLDILNKIFKANESVYIVSRTYQFCWLYAILLVWKRWSGALNQLNVKDQVYSNTQEPTRVNTGQHESTRVNTNQHKSTRINTNLTRINTSPTQVNTNQPESKKSLDHKK